MVPEDYKKYQKINNWKAAIGLQAVDGLKPSEYLYELAGRHIDGELDIDEVQKFLHSYYENKGERAETEYEATEADKVSANIIKVLEDERFDLSADEYRSIHESLFEGVFQHAGVYRVMDIIKREWVLQYDTVEYGHYSRIIPELENLMSEEAQYRYEGKSKEQQLEHFADFIAKLWLIHPFMEGNTRTTAIFAIKYLHTFGKDVNNEVFRNYSWFFRNALARANYSNSRLGITKDSSHLYNFFHNLLDGTNIPLRNRDILISPPKGWDKRTNADGHNSDVVANVSKKDISNIQIYKHNQNLYCIKCEIDHQIQKAIPLSIKDLMTYEKFTGDKDELQNLLMTLAEKYYEAELSGNNQVKKNPFKR